MDLKTKSIGLILSGGGSKGLAHAGVIKFLEEKQKINFMLMKLLAEEKIELAYDTKTVYVKE